MIKDKNAFIYAKSLPDVSKKKPGWVRKGQKSL